MIRYQLVRFCRENGIRTSGGKTELSERIAHFLETGEIRCGSARSKRTGKSKALSDITLDSLIEPNFVCSEIHRTFFREQIGSSFSFNVAFQKWLKGNAGKSYADAVAAYYEIKASRKTEKKRIDRQFEYNTYIRDFFAQNKGRSLDDAIQCWKYKKSQPGHNRYEEADLAALMDIL